MTRPILNVPIGFAPSVVDKVERLKNSNDYRAVVGMSEPSPYLLIAATRRQRQ